MSNDRPKRDTISIEEATISHMWEIAAIVEVLERKGLCTKQDLYGIIPGFRRKNPRARICETASLSRTSSPKPRTRSSMTSWHCSTSSG